MSIYIKGGKFADDTKPKKKKSVPNVRNVESKLEADFDDQSAFLENPSHEARIAARKAESEKRKNRNIWITAALIFFAIIAATLIFLFVRKLKVENDYRKLAQQVQQAEQEHLATAPSTEARHHSRYYSHGT